MEMDRVRVGRMKEDGIATQEGQCDTVNLGGGWEPWAVVS